MNWKKIGGAAVAGAITLSLVAFAPSAAVAADESVEIAAPTTYYVSADGSDDNSGTSQDAPFQTLDKVNTLTLHAGDKILLKRGDTFQNQHLCISGDADFKFNDGSGCAFQADVDGAPLVISAYGEGDAKPVIAANGTGKWKLDYGLTLAHDQHYLQRDNVSSAVMLKDAENIELRDLEITNQRVEDAQGLEDGCAYNDNCALDRTGVAGIAQNRGTLDHVVLQDLYVHDVEGNVYNKHSLNGAIYFSALIASDDIKPEAERTDPGFVPSTEKPAAGYPRFNDLQIVDNRVADSGRWGIAGVYSAYASAALDGLDQIPSADITKYGATNVVMSRNYIRDIGGDALTVMYAYKPVIESNVASNIAAQINDTDYLWKYTGGQGANNGVVAAGNEGKFDKRGGRVAASIWPWKSKDAVFRFNEGFTTLGADKGNGDGMPWDADSGDGTVYEYNYSANNSGGTVMFCGHQAANSTFRFNIAQNDAMGALSPTYWVPSYTGLYPNAHVYNNTFYMTDGASILHPAQAQQGTMKVENNIFYWAGDTARTETWNPSGTITWGANDIDGNAKITYSHNLYYNYTNTPESDQHPVKVAQGTAVLANPGAAPVEPAADMQARAHYFPELSFAEADAQQTAFDGYKLAADSPAIGKGKAITDWNGFAISTDFFGREANTFDIGAVSTDNPPSAVDPENTAAAKLVSTFYQVTAANGDSKNGEYAAGNVIHVPSTAMRPSTVGVVIANITFEGEKVTVVDASGAEQAADTVITDGMKLKITGANNTSLEFPIEIDNVYNWRDDYTYNLQGNVWFGQKQDGADGDWVNIESSSPEWPNWVVDQAYGPGIDAQVLDPEDRSTTHGLLSDSPKSEGFTAMAWRAPKTGYIKFQVLPADTANNRPAEPYLRQGDATGGEVKIKLIVNGVVKREMTLETHNVRPRGDFDFTAAGQWALKVNRGDYVRVVAESTGTPAQPSIHVTPIITYFDRNIDTAVSPTTAESENLTVGGTNLSPTSSPTPTTPSLSKDPVYVEGKAPSFALEMAEDGTVSGKVTLPDVEGVTYTVNDAPLAASYGAGEVIVKATAKEGYVLGESATTEWKFAVPAQPKFDSATGKLEIPTIAGVTYDAESQTVKAGASVTVTAMAAEGYSFGKAYKVEWTFKADAKNESSETTGGNGKPSDTSSTEKPVESQQPETPVLTPEQPAADENTDSAKGILSDTGAGIVGVLTLAGILGATGGVLRFRRED